MVQNFAGWPGRSAVRAEQPQEVRDSRPGRRLVSPRDADGRPSGPPAAARICVTRLTPFASIISMTGVGGLRGRGANAPPRCDFVELRAKLGRNPKPLLGCVALGSFFPGAPRCRVEAARGAYAWDRVGSFLGVLLAQGLW
jgi:hypothetical protein